MENNKRNIDDLFHAAKHEPSEFSPADVQTIVNGAEAHSRRRGPIMMLSIVLGTTAAVAAMFIGVQSYLSPDSLKSTNTKPVALASVASNRALQPVSATASVSTQCEAIDTPVKKAFFNPLDSQAYSAPLCAVYDPGIALNDLPGVSDEFVRALFADKNGTGHSLKLSTVVENGVSTTTIRVYANGLEKVIELKGDGAEIPRMITTRSGTGRVISGGEKITVDPNTLIPVATRSNDMDVLLWYHPTEGMVRGFPDSLRHEILSMISGSLTNINKQMGDIHVIRKVDSDIDSDLAVDSENEYDLANEMEWKTTYVDSINRDGVKTMIWKTANEFELPSSVVIVKSENDRLGCESTTKEFRVLDVSVDSSTQLSLLEKHDDSTMKQLRARGVDLKTVEINFEVRDVEFEARNIALETRTVDLNARTQMLMDLNDSTVSIMTRRIQLLDGEELPNDQSLKTMNRIIVKRDNTSAVEMNSSETMKDDKPVRSTRIVCIVRKGKSPKLVTPAEPVPTVQELRTSNDVVTESKLYPNPTFDRGAKLDFTLKSPQLISASLMTLDGVVVQQLLPPTMKPAGPNVITFELKDAPSGMYMVVLTPQNGSQIVQRLIVN